MTVPPGSAARRGFWAATAMGALFLAFGFVSPVPGVFNAVLFFAVAWGISRGRAWAAISGACFLAFPYALMVYRLPESAGAGWSSQLLPLLLPTVILLLAVPLLLGAARALEAGAPRARPWPWVALVVAVAGLWAVGRPYAMPAASMADTLLAGDHLLVETASLRLGRLPCRGDIVVLRYPVNPKQTFIKRVAGVPGDRLHIGNKRLYRNGELIPEPWASHKTGYVDAYRDNFPAQPSSPIDARAEEMLRDHVRDGEVVVPEGMYFVLGDNRDNSLDSRYWGFVPREAIVGRPVLIYGSYEGAPPAADGTAFNTRWGRLLKRVS